jgi:glutamate/tyrosine decarboxylase-like PLP-dependent enzyme
MEEAAELVLQHSLRNGHPRFMGYITSSAAPIGALADLLASAVNSNVAAWEVAPVASEVEAQTIRWIAELVGYPVDCGGILVSGGNMANFVCFLAGRRAMLGNGVRSGGLAGARHRVYVSSAAHNWVEKATDLFGLGTDAIGWIPVDSTGRMNPAALRDRLQAHRAAGENPLMVVGTAGTVGTGAVDPIRELAVICREQKIWLHVDGAYGAPAAVLPDAPPDLHALALADSLAVDPHKWLYAPIEAGCVLVRDPARLPEAFGWSPSYYRFAPAGEELPINYHELGLQNSRGFRALKVWLGLRRAGRVGYQRMIADDCRMAAELYRAAETHAEIEALTLNLSIATFRYRPPDLPAGGDGLEEYLDQLNEAVLARLKSSGEFFVSNAVLDGRFALRACIVNFRTTLADAAGIPERVAHIGRALDATMRPAGLTAGAAR